MELGLKHIDEWPFGKHKGKSIKDLPTEYLVWVVYDSDINGYPLKWAIQELDRREAGLRGGFEVPPDNDGRLWGEDVW